MSIIEEALQNSGGPYWNGGQNAPVGSYWNPRTNAVKQLAADGALPNDGRWIQLSTNSGDSLATCATNINNLVPGLGITAGQLHTPPVNGDLAFTPGQATNDG